MDINQFVIYYWGHIAAQNEEALKKYFHENAHIRWHSTNEEFNVSEFLRANCDYPGSWSGEVERIEHLGNLIITVTRVWSEKISFHVTSFFEMDEDKIRTVDEYWGEDEKAPQWRIDKNIGTPIH
jgi:hypothetical protein